MKRKRIVAELDCRHLEVSGDKASYRPRINRLIISSGWNDAGIKLDISTAPLKSQNWPNGMTLKAEDWNRVVRVVAKIIRHCERERRKQQKKFGRSGGEK